MHRLILLSLFSLTIVQKSQCEEYYWVDYNGTMPDEAVSGGYDTKDEEIFIGQAETDLGQLVGGLQPNKLYIEAILDGKIVQLNSSLKILCGPEPHFDWLRANGENLHVVLLYKQGVIGGKFSGNFIHIGRINYQNKVIIGPIFSEDLNSASLFSVYKNKILKTTVYEVLTVRRERPPRRRHGPRRKGPRD